MTETLRIGLDGRAFSSPAAGVRRYVNGLTRALLALGEPLSVVALGGTNPSVIPEGVGHVAEPPHLPTNLGWTMVGLPQAAWRAGVDVVHAPAYTAPLWSPVPVVLTIHDVSYQRHPQWYPYRRDWVRRAFYRASAHAASRVLTISHFSETEIMAAYGIPAERIAVTPLGVDGGFLPGDVDRPGDPLAGIRQPYLLHVGDLHERRNLAMLVEAVLEARRDSSPVRQALSLVLAGEDRGVGDTLRAIAERSGEADAVVRLGAVDEADLRRLYAGAIALVYPSLYEGFGLPIVEAMACGVPVIASRAASMPEVLGDAGILLDPSDRGAWTQAIIDVVGSERTRARCRAAGLRRSAEFTWARTATLTLEAYRQVCAR
ncbi:MAG: glycosyltransferase family 1 protein [Acidobacteria bacterium]|nr:glycosyltransferase family 1 protein [Acidobacteriota bacterium]